MRGNDHFKRKKARHFSYFSHLTSVSIPRGQTVPSSAEANHTLDRSRCTSPAVFLFYFFHADASHVAPIRHLVFAPQRQSRGTINTGYRLYRLKKKKNNVSADFVFGVDHNI